jgi:hypothetical protein
MCNLFLFLGAKGDSRGFCMQSGSSGDPGRQLYETNKLAMVFEMLFNI